MQFDWTLVGEAAAIASAVQAAAALDGCLGPGDLTTGQSAGLPGATAEPLSTGNQRLPSAYEKSVLISHDLIAIAIKENLLGFYLIPVPWPA
jgi:hypothetical protein